MINGSLLIKFAFIEPVTFCVPFYRISQNWWPTKSTKRLTLPYNHSCICVNDRQIQHWTYHLVCVNVYNNEMKKKNTRTLEHKRVPFLNFMDITLRRDRETISYVCDQIGESSCLNNTHLKWTPLSNGSSKVTSSHY